MIYKGVVAWLDGPPDSAGDILGKDVKITRNPVKVTHEFYEKTNIGNAHLEIEDDRVIAYVDLFDQDLWPAEIVTNLHIVIGGKILDRYGPNIKSFSIESTALTSTPADKTLPKLEVSPTGQRCCWYIGPPFVKCYKCGGRNSV